MAREIIRTDKAPQSPFYSQATKAGDLLFVSSQGPFDAKTGDVTGTTIQEQVRQCLMNISAILWTAGSSLEKIVSTTFILAEEDDFDGLNEEWARWFPTDPPARQGAKLPIRREGMRVSIGVIAQA